MNSDELFSFYPGSVNCLFGDGSVRFIKASISPVALRGLVTLNGSAYSNTVLANAINA